MVRQLDGLARFGSGLCINVDGEMKATEQYKTSAPEVGIMRRQLWNVGFERNLTDGLMRGRSGY